MRRLLDPRNRLVNAWKRLEHVHIHHVVDLSSISWDGVKVDLNLDSMNGTLAMLDLEVVGNIMGNFLPYLLLNLETQRQWGHLNEFQFSAIGQDFFVCDFPSVEARDVVLCGGP